MEIGIWRHRVGILNLLLEIEVMLVYVLWGLHNGLSPTLHHLKNRRTPKDLRHYYCWSPLSYTCSAWA
ncbi:hypothetical protein ASPTUDRAFT_858049 [Aspergillus tubingensis CBS 134.48]|uniref:Uncharacterized protein n=1 Tax=Aspergillus tubingensis (strain CBS 134.48) TaxID=767770 RepID=A0A1L9MU21_ASPTC|nr:hypothetical protein ASPTUDRAFT_858049 [Aspergillus tubingensis CBS 134.48]